MFEHSSLPEYADSGQRPPESRPVPRGFLGFPERAAAFDDALRNMFPEYMNAPAGRASL